MEGWLVGLFTLLGVLVGGVFTYLGLREQLKQQQKMDSQQWKRNVRSEPLLQLRKELAEMATKAEILAKAGFTYAAFTQGKKQEDETLKKAIDDWGKYISSGDLNRILHIQSDTELVKLVKEITVEYLSTYDDVVHKDMLPRVEWWIALAKAEVEIYPKVTQAQELINKRLEEL